MGMPRLLPALPPKERRAQSQLQQALPSHAAGPALVILATSRAPLEALPRGVRDTFGGAAGGVVVALQPPGADDAAGVLSRADAWLQAPARAAAAAAPLDALLATLQR